MKNKQRTSARICQGCTWQRILSIATLSATIALSGCGGGSDNGIIDTDTGGGIIGTGVDVRGTVTTKRAFAQSDIQIKSLSGELKSAAITANGRFEATDLAGDGPYLMRADLGNTNSYYAIAHSGNTDSVIQNVHAYSDVALRNWFAVNGLDIDSAFESSGAIAQLPTAAEINAINSSIRALVALSLDAYGLSTINLQTASFDADDTGLDLFLDRNTVLVNNGSITIIIKDRTDDTVGTVSDDLPIDTDLTSLDMTPPSAPTDLRVLPSASNEIVLAWNSATDNIGVTAYQVSRDGVVVATTPYPVYMDINLAANTTFTYTIAALDAAGNVSLQSAPGSSQTLAAPDTTPPPAPTAVQLTPTTASIDVRWTQADIADVASFRVLRSEGSSMLDSLALVTSTGLIDVDLNSGVEYCYQVIALDASENESAPTSVACANTSGAVVGTSTTPSTPTTPNTPTQGTGASYLLDLNVSSTACTDIVEFTSVDTNVTLAGSCLLVNRSITVATGGNLTIAPGTVLKFAAGQGIRVNRGGSLTATGTMSSPIVLTGQDRTPGYWDGVEFVFSNSSNNRFENVLVEYGGESGTNGAAILLTGSTSNITRVSMNNVVLRHSVSDGFYFADGSIIPEFSNVISTNNARPGSVTPELAGSISSTGSYTGNTSDEMHIRNGTVSNITELPLLNVPWSVGDLTLNAPLSINAGSELRFRSGGGVRINSDGSLRAVGTATQPILLTAAEPTPGFWDGLSYVFSGSANNQLEHVTVEYGGDGSTSRANLNTTSSGSNRVRLSLNNVTLRFGVGPGFRFNEGTTLSSFNNISVTGNDSTGVVYPLQLSEFGSNLDFTGNGINEILLLRMTVASSQTWPTVNVPYRFNDITVNAPLTLSPGTVMIANSGSDIRVNRDGSFNAVGTPAAPITLMGGERTPGHWDGISFVFANSPQNVLDNVLLSDAGAGTAASSGNVSLTCSASNPGQISVRNSTISNSASWGVYRSNEDCAVNLGANVSFTGNAQGTVNTP